MSTLEATSRLQVLRGAKVLVTLIGRARPGLNRAVWNGKLGKKRPTPGLYRLRLTLANGDQTAIVSGSVKVSR